MLYFNVNGVPGLHFGVFPVVGAWHLPLLRVAPQHRAFVVCVSLALCGECFSPRFIPWLGCLHPHPVVDLCWIGLGLLFGFSYILDSASALLFCCPGMWMNLSLYLVSHCDHLICLGPAWDFCMKVFSASWSVTICILGIPRSASSHFLSASMTPSVSCSYVKYALCASVNFFDMKPAGLIVFQSLPCP